MVVVIRAVLRGTFLVTILDVDMGGFSDLT